MLAGLGSALQTAFNGRIGAEAGTPITPTVLNFAEGVLALIVATVIHRLTADLPPWHFPSEWWLYLGGVCGVLFVAAGAVLSRIIGILRTSLSLTAGMLTGALLLDGAMPVDEIKSRLELPDLPSEGSYHTLGGLLLALLRRVPKAGDRIVFAGWRFEVVEMDGRRVAKVSAMPEPAAEG